MKGERTAKRPFALKAKILSGTTRPDALNVSGVRQPETGTCRQPAGRFTPPDQDANAPVQVAGVGTCAICLSPRILDNDHDHRNGFKRGRICRSCNTGLGHFHDNINALHRAADYVEHYNNYPTGETKSNRGRRKA